MRNSVEEDRMIEREGENRRVRGGLKEKKRTGDEDMGRGREEERGRR